MNKNQAVKIMKCIDCEIAQVYISFAKGGKAYHTNVLVYLVDEPSNGDQVINCEHWYIFSNVDEFKSEILKKTSPIVDFIKVSEFKTDFNV